MTDFLGVKTRVSYMYDLEGRGGEVEGPPTASGYRWEWLALLDSVRTAGPVFRMFELGAGFGTWLVRGAVASRLTGRSAELLGVEASEDHYQWMLEHCRENGIDPGQHRLYLGAVAAEDGEVSFPKLPDPRHEWGATVTDQRGVWWDRVPAYSIATLLQPFDHVDYVHIDIQGAEFDAVASGASSLHRKVRRLCIGTHSREIELRLAAALLPHAWEPEYFESCAIENGKLTRDGLLVLKNSRFA